MIALSIVILLIIFIPLLLMFLYILFSNKEECHEVEIGDYEKDSFINKMKKYKEAGYYPNSDVIINEHGKYIIRLKKDIKGF